MFVCSRSERKDDEYFLNRTAKRTEMASAELD